MRDAAGDMKRYRVHYRCEGDTTGPVFTCTRRALDAEHATELFYEFCGDEGWEIVDVHVIAERPQYASVGRFRIV